MDARQSAYLNMGEAVLTTSKAHHSAWNGFAPFADSLAELTGLMDVAHDAIGLQATKSAGATEDKRAARIAVAGSMERLSDALLLYGNFNDNSNLAGEAHIQPGRMMVLGGKAFVGLGRKLLRLAESLPSGALTPYGAAPEVILATTAQMDAFTDKLDAPRHAKSRRERGTRDLKNAIIAMRALLKDRLDPAARVLQYEHPAFYSEYKTAREIVDAGTTPNALNARVTAEFSGTPVADATVTVNPGGIVKTTTAAGRFSLRKLPPGDYSVTISALNYEPFTQDFTIVAGKPLRLGLQLRAP